MRTGKHRIFKRVFLLVLFFALSGLCLSICSVPFPQYSGQEAADQNEKEEARARQELLAGPWSWSLPLGLPDAPELGSRSAVVMDTSTGALLFSKDPDVEIPPASLTKLMTIHILLEEIAAGRANLEEVLNPPEASWAENQPEHSSLMFLHAGQSLTLRELIMGLAVPSGNDAAVAAALRVSPTMEEFSALMNREAQKFGLSRTRFVESSGISEKNMTTAMEFALFCREYIRLHPETLKEFHSVREFAYPKAANVGAALKSRPGTIVQYNRNNLLYRFPGTDGLKTGYIDESGYNIALTAEREGFRLIAVILGAPANSTGIRIRDDDGGKLLTWAFENFKTVKPEIAPLEPAPVWKGNLDFVHIAPAGDLAFTTLKNRAEELSCAAVVKEPLMAPLAAGTEVGAVIFSDSGGELRRVPLITTEEIEEGGFFKKLWHNLRLFFR
ncbi:MAG: D-alanyl-D-alanine carboxypeptidase [Treponema sp.]|jgi:D-alanyl-D-alanine carboxypeptidase (penicillin-binding protein 5/6)|nr:D-alanyl-D-alanine carboxypeptidase [Treponema sp.]